MISLQQANVPGAGQPMLAASAWFIVGLALGVAPLWLDSGTLRLLTEWLCLLALAQMWNLLAGHTNGPKRPFGQQPQSHQRVRA